VALAREEEEEVRTFLAVGDRVRRHHYSARASRRPKFAAWDSPIAREGDKFLFPRRFGASAGGAGDGSRTLNGK
jgi:hypothetical protein